MTRRLLDTNVLLRLVHDPNDLVRERIMAEGGFRGVCTSVIVAGELRFGVERRQSRRLAEQVETLLAGIHVLPFDEPADRRYAELRAVLERAGTPIGGNDMLIAAHALALGCVLVTDNVGELSRVPGLVVENWLR